MSTMFVILNKYVITEPVSARMSC